MISSAVLRAVAVGATLVLLAASVDVGDRLAAATRPGDLPRVAGLDFSADHVVPFASVTSAFIAEVFGAAGPRTAVAPPAAGTITPPTAARPEMSGSTPAHAGQVPEISGQHSLVMPGRWALAVFMTGDRPVARSGDWIVYRIIVVNVGSAEFPGVHFQLSWHTPYGTTSYPPSSCGQFQPDVESLCHGVQPPVPGPPNQLQPYHHNLIGVDRLRIPSHGSRVYSWRVQVNQSAHDTITNHAHLNVTGAAQTLTTAAVVVEVR